MFAISAESVVVDGRRNKIGKKENGALVSTTNALMRNILTKSGSANRSDFPRDFMTALRTAFVLFVTRNFFFPHFSAFRLGTENVARRFYEQFTQIMRRTLHYVSFKSSRAENL